MTKKLVTWMAVMLTAALLSSNAWAGPATDVVRTNQTRLFQVIAQPRTPSRQAQLRTLFDEVLAYDQFAVGSLGKEWDKRTDDERARFTTLLTKLIRGNYRRNLKKLLDFNIEYSGEEAAKGGGVLVNSMAKHKTDKRELPFELDFVVRNVGGKLMTVDIVTEGASMVGTYRARFLRILRKDGFEALLSKMQKKLDKMDRELDD